MKLLYVSALLFAGALTVAPHASGNTIEQLAHDTVAAELDRAYPAATYRVTPLPVAAAQQLQPCEQLSAEVRSRQLYGRVPVHVRCAHPQPWSLYASVQVDVDIPVVVTRRALARGTRIGPEDVAMEPRAIHRLRPQTLSRAEDAVGKVLRRAIHAGQPLSMNQLTQPWAVTKGERVHVVAGSGRVRIHAFGTALANGAVGDQIKVRNDTSDRVIQPWIVAPGKVSTRPPDA